VHEVIWSVRAEFLETALETMDREHGGVQGYLSQRVKLTEAARQRLAMLYLEAPTR